jgi:hypothetical protein
VAEADTIVAFKGSAEWDAASTATKEGVLVEAAQRIDRLAFVGTKSATTQALAFPRTGGTDANGDLEIHQRIKRAQAFLALALLEDPDLFEGGCAKTVSVTGSFSVTKGGSSGVLGGYPESVTSELQPWIYRYGPGPSKAWNSARRSYE